MSTMYTVIFAFVFILNSVLSLEEHRTVILEEGGVIGQKHWNGDYYEFYGIPYATVPKGRDRFKGPLPVVPWNSIIEAKTRSVMCYQSFYSDGDEEPEVYGDEECLVINVLVPAVANETNLIPVIVYIHSGAFAVGNGNIAKFQYLVRHDVIVVSFNFRLGAIGFACLGTEDIPGNAGMKDQVAALKWIKKNIKKFGGDPNKITLAGFSVGATMAELLALSKSSSSLIDKLILESGSALSPFAVNRDPINTARNIAISVGYKDRGKIEELNEFYLNASIQSLSAKSLHFFLTNSTFGFAPCIENVFDNSEPFLTESPTDIMEKGNYNKVPIITGFADMEGLSRTIKFDSWIDMMNDKFSEFLPADLIFNDDKSRNDLVQTVKDRYFKGQKVSEDTVQNYIDYFSDSMFKYSIMKSAKRHAAKTGRPVYFYEFSYVGELNMKHRFMDRIKGASHRDQTAYILDFLSFTNKYDDLDTRHRLTTMWTDFVKYGDPTAFESSLVDFKWLTYSNEDPNYLEINKKIKVKKNLFADEYKFWEKIYDKYYWNPEAPRAKKSTK